MLLSIWNFLRGYVIIEVSGFSVERFMNLAAHRGIFIWGAERLDSGSTKMRVSVAGFFKLRECARKTKCKIKIMRRAGLAFRIRKYKNRWSVAVGAAFFVAVLYFLSSFLWVVEIPSAKMAENNSLTTFLAEKGLYAGAAKFGLNPKKIQKAVMTEFPAISWFNIKISGTRAVIDFTEIKPKVTAPPTEPCDIVAARDGIIISAATSAGTPLVKAGDVVRAGDVLVSGKLEIGNEESGIKYEYVHAQSEIWAKTFYNFSFDVPLLYEERAYTGRKSSGYVLTIVDKDIKLSKAPVPFTKNEKITDVKRLSFGKNYPLPFYLTKTTFKEFTNIPVERSVEQAMKIGAETVSERIFREFGFAAVVSAQDISYEEKEKAVSVNARITLIERIGDERTN